MIKSIQFTGPFISRLSKNIKSYFFISASSILLLFLSQILLARLMGADSYGVYIYTLSWLSILVLIAKLGLDTTLLRFIPQYSSKEKWGLCKGITTRSLLTVAASACLLALATYCLLPFFEARLETNLAESFRIALWIVPLLSLIKITQSIHLASKNYLFSQLADGILAPAGIMLGALIISLVFNIQVSAQITLKLSIIIYGLALVLSAILIKRTFLPVLAKRIPSEYQTKSWLSTAIPILIISGMQIVMNQTDILAIGYFMDTTMAGIYSACSRIAAFISLPLILAGTALSPYIAELYSNSKNEELQQTVLVVVIVGSMLGGVILISLWLFGDMALYLFGKEFMAGKHALLILTIGQIINSLSGPTGIFMMMTGHQNIAAYLLLSSAILNVILNLTLIPMYGIEGAASATAISIIYWNIVLAVFIFNRTRINTTILAIIK